MQKENTKPKEKKEKEKESSDHITYWKIWTVRNPYQLPSTQ